jgi:hypothetical protein
MKKSIASMVGILVLASAGAVSAQNLKMTPYLGVAGGFSSWNLDCSGATDCKKNPGSARVFGGVNLTPNVAVELTYSSLGSPSVTSGGVTSGLKGSSTDLSALYKFGAANSNLGFFVKGGLAYTAGKLSTPTSSGTEKGWGLILGAGVTYALTPSIGLRAEVDTQKIKVPGSSGNVTTLVLGGQAAF